MNLNQIVPLLITYNERPNIARTLKGLRWASRIVVVDSGSTDGTREILQADSRIQSVVRPFDTFADQCNFGLGLIEDAPWVLYLDADHVVTDDLVAEIQNAPDAGDVAGCECRFTYCIEGRPIRGGLYPPRIVLFRRDLGTFVNDGHGHHVEVRGAVRRLSSTILHDDRKPLSRWLKNQDGYMEVEKTKLLASRWSDVDWPDRIRKMVFVAPWLFPIIFLIGRGGILSGWAGLHYAAQRSLAEMVLSLKLIEAKITKEEEPA